MAGISLISGSAVLPRDASSTHSLRSRLVVAWCGMANLFVAWAFAYLDRRLGHFATEAVLWLIWSGVGYTSAVLGLRRETSGRRIVVVLLTIVACMLAFPGFLAFDLLRWTAFSLLLLASARAPAMSIARHLYLNLASIIAASLVVATHFSADWTVWFYLGPAWFFVVMAMAWDYAQSVELSAVRKGWLTLAFLGVCIALSAAVYTLIPRPQILGFGFIPPGTDAPQWKSTEERRPGWDTGEAVGGQGGRGSAGRGSAGRGSAGQGSASWDSVGRDGDAGRNAQETLLGRAINAMRDAQKDGGQPQWQRNLLGGILGAAEAAERVAGSVRGQVVIRRETEAERAAAQKRAQAMLRLLGWLLVLLCMALLAWLLWRLRWRMAIAAGLFGAWALTRWWPAASLRFSVWTGRRLLHKAGHRIAPGSSVLEHVSSATAIPPRAREWLLAVATRYCECRFGGTNATRPVAVYCYQATLATAELLHSRLANRKKS